MTVRLDWLQVTVRDDLPPSIIMDRIADKLPLSHHLDHRPRGFNGYHKSAILLDQQDRVLFTMQHGGNRGAPPNLYASGPDTPAFADAIRSLRLSYDVTRADPCGDLEGADFDQVAGQVRVIARAHQVKGKTDLPDNPEVDGVTYTVGAPTSAVRCRVYRKDLELIAKGVSPDEFPHPIVRVEGQIRPKGALRRVFATMEPEEMFGASRWLRKISLAVLENNPSLITMQKREPTDYDRQVTWLRTQCAKALSAVHSRHPGHEAFGKFLVENIINP